MCHEGGQPWKPVPFRRGWALRPRPADGSGRGALRVRILCGAYDPYSPFIEGGCASDWIEVLEEPSCALRCPGCGQHCPEEVVDCARSMLQTRSVFVFGCFHRAFTFSRRQQEPYFAVLDVPEERREDPEDGRRG
ncbi:MAG: hypothetical protein HY293_13495 [Planctomycetes bacterium]|nr:hypothetical protein [Planctomycetota bacterium]